MTLPARRRDLLAAIAMTAAAGRFAPASAALAMNKDAPEERAIEPDLAIVDPHHHMRDYRDLTPGQERYLAADFLSDILRSGHRIIQTLFVECGIMYRPDGPVERRSLGETDYIARLGDDVAARRPPTCAIAAGIVGKVDLRVGARADDLLRAHMEAGGGRLKGIRNSIAWDAYPPLAGMGLNKDLLTDPAFLEGFKALEPLGLSFDIWLFHPQIASLTALARRFPGTSIIVNHCGGPLGIGPYADRQAEVRRDWGRAMAELATCPNVCVKLGGLGPFGPRPEESMKEAGSSVLAAQWRPFIERSIDLFGVERCMFESNWPANAGVASYGATWNAFKIIARGASATEKSHLFRRTAQKVYQL
ncbi:amidohydrolase family protein [Sphingobium sp. CR2-8]|uniref:amidohydrolase family protein n=1 Tax=Sphingobium sp. CR2-8 TaxID=1306534 RepID=UPI002DB94480|nr:amidohydrolase family protein [Sphingobium sp. CR2-8]MEC3912407.1 amidohydrolase family protein [Sphingobium sp. CR2-8]